MYLHRAMQKHGIENFTYIVVGAVEGTQEQADKIENLLIEAFSTRNPDIGYNLKPGGNATSGWHRAPFTDDHRRKLSESHKGQIVWMTGKKHSEETKAKMRKPHNLSSEMREQVRIRNKINGSKANRKSKYSEELQKALVTDFASGLSHAELQEKYNLPLGSVKMIIKRNFK